MIMDNRKQLMLGLLVGLLLLTGLVFATDFIPSGNISGRGIYDIYNMTFVNATNFYGALAWSYISNVPLYVMNYTPMIDSLNSTKAGIGNCTANQFVQNTTTGGVQCMDIPATGVTQVTAGEGLNATTITTTGTLNVNTTYMQRRVGSTCTTGIGLINEDGSVSCSAPQGNDTAAINWLNTTKLQNGSSANFTSVVSVGNITTSDYFVGSINYKNITNGPVACGANQFMTYMDFASGTQTCTSVQATELSLTINGNLTVTGNINESGASLNSKYNDSARIDSVNGTAVAKASPGNCPYGQAVQNTTTGGVQCVSVGTGNVSGYGIPGYIAGWSNTTSGGYCYQEFANASTACGGLSSGSYRVVTTTSAYVEINYTKPSNASSLSLWQVKYGINYTNITVNYSIPASCWAYSNTLTFTLGNGSNTKSENATCFNGTNYVVIAAYGPVNVGGGGSDHSVIYDGDYSTSCARDSTNCYTIGFGGTPAVTFFEEGMYWDMITTNLRSSVIYQNGTKIGINTQTPVVELDVNGSGNYNGNVTVNGLIASDPTMPRYYVGVNGSSGGFIIGQNGTPMWDMSTYDGENSKFLYVGYNYNSGETALTFTEAGRVGVNKLSNELLPDSGFTGVGLDDMRVGGTYTGEKPLQFEVLVQNGSVFQYRTNRNNAGWGAYSANITMSTSPITLTEGVTVSFGNVTGHVAGNLWYFTAFSQNPQGTMTIDPPPYQTVYAFTGSNYRDLTFESGTSAGSARTVFSNTSGYLYVSRPITFKTTYFYLATLGAGVTLKTEYWNGTGWFTLGSAHAYTDGTSNLTKSGSVGWDTSLMPDWANTSVNGTDGYWIRYSTTTNPTTAPMYYAVTPQGVDRLQVYQSPFDTIPVFAVKPDGRGVFSNSIYVGYGASTTDSLSTATTAAGMFLPKKYIAIDSTDNDDAGFVMGHEGLPVWDMSTYINEEGKYLHLGINYRTAETALTAAETGRLGIFKPSNVMQYHAAFNGTGLNDLGTYGTYTGQYYDKFQVRANSTNTFQWRYAVNGNAWNAWSANVTINGSYQALYKGVEIKFDNVNGHTAGDVWDFTAFANNPAATVTINPSRYQEVSFYNGSAYKDITYEAASSTGVTFVPLNNTNQYLYVSRTIPTLSSYINLLTNGAGLTLTVAYWNGTGWQTMGAAEELVDGSANFSQSGAISWNIDAMPNWNINASVSDYTSTNGLYWIRYGTTTNATTLPVADSVSPQGFNRLAVFQNNLDDEPVLAVAGNGDTTTTGTLFASRLSAPNINQMQSNTLLDGSYSTITTNATAAVFTIFADDGSGEWNFDSVFYGGKAAVANASIVLLNGTNANPKTNHVYFYLLNNVPTLATAESYPTMIHIDVATVIVGNSTNIYAYTRTRQEIDNFVSGVLRRLEYGGTLYVSGFTTTSNTLQLNVSTGTYFGNSIKEYTTINNNTLAGGFYFINSTGQYIQGTSLANLTQYSDGTAFTGGNERVNIVWGLVSSNSSSNGTTQVRLVAVLPSYPGAGNTYQSVANAIQDNYGTTTYYPPVESIKNGFVPIARTILRPSTDVFEPFATGIYHRFLAGTVSTGGASPSPTSNNHATLDNLDYSVAGHTGFASTGYADSLGNWSGNQSSYATLASTATNLGNWSGNISSYATLATTAANIGNWSGNISSYATLSATASNIGNWSGNASSYYTSAQTLTLGNWSGNISNYATLASTAANLGNWSGNISSYATLSATASNIGNWTLDKSGYSTVSAGIGWKNITNITASTLGVMVNTTAAKPTCASGYRGTFWYDQGGAGVTDYLYMCMKNVSDAYNWVQIAYGG
jgi:hypothetical protein